MVESVAPRSLTWEQLKKLARAELSRKGELPSIYQARLDFELKQIEVQGSNTTWVNYFNDRKKFASNPSRLILPWLLKMVREDPVATLNEKRDGLYLTDASYKIVSEILKESNKLPVDIYQDSDKPDIDLDCLSEAREPIKKYATIKYSAGKEMTEDEEAYGFVCSVGTWQTYLFRSAIIDVWKAMDCGSKDVVLAMTTQLPDEVDELKDGGKSSCKNRITPPGGGEPKECGTIHDQVKCPQCDSDATESPTIARLLQDHEVLRRFNDVYPEQVRQAVGLVGRIKTMGKHAGALIIADRALYGNLPLARRDGKDKHTGEAVTHWLSMWTEGRKTELSKFGYNKWDILGLKNLKFISTCCKLIEQNRGLRFGDRLEGWDLIDPEDNIAGWYEERNRKTGEWVRHIIPLNDPAALKLANDQKTDAVFQFDTDLAKRILSNGVENFEDLMLFNAMGHPGPMDSIPEAVTNRADTLGEWRGKLNAEILDVLKDTYGVIVYQEQLQTLWQRIAGFTAPQAQEARKAVAKKWKHLLKPIRQKWIDGAKKKLGEQAATEWWDKMETFGRYAFNRCLSEDTRLQDVNGQWRNIKDASGMVLESEHGPDLVVDVHCNGEEQVYEVVFDNGAREEVTAGHRYLTDNGYITAAQLNLGHAVEYIDGGDECHDYTQEAVGARRGPGCRVVFGGQFLQGDIGGREWPIHFGQDNHQDSGQVRGETGIQNQDAQEQVSYLSGRTDPGRMLLDWVVDGRWVLKRFQMDGTAPIAREGRYHRAEVRVILRRSLGPVYTEEEGRSSWTLSHAEVGSLQQEIGRQIGLVRSHPTEVGKGVDTGPSVHGELHPGLPGWRWNGVHHQERLPGGWIRFRLELQHSTGRTIAEQGAGIEPQSTVSVPHYGRFKPAGVDWLEAVSSDTEVAPQRAGASYGQEESPGRLHIRSITPLGVMTVYSPEMLSASHNYSIALGHPIAANSHAVAYCLVAYRCLWLKAHFPAEWWAAVMSDCHPDKLVRYMGVAKSEGVNFDTFNINHLTINFTVTGDNVNQGLIGLKRVGMSAAKVFQLGEGGEKDYTDIDQFVAAHPRNKTVLERLIKLGSFSHLHGENSRYAVWNWYLYKYGSGKEASAVRRYVQEKLIEVSPWTEDTIKEERKRQIYEYRLRYPKRNKVPEKYLNWVPKPDDSRDNVLSLFPVDYTTPELLTFEKEYLGYYLSNPLARYEYCPQFDIKKAKRETLGPVHAVVMRVDFSTTKKGDEMCRVNLYDGKQMALLLLWSDDCEKYRAILTKAQEALTRDIKPRGDTGVKIIPSAPKHELGVGVNVRYSSAKGQGSKSFTLLRQNTTMWLLPPTKVKPTHAAQ